MNIDWKRKLTSRKFWVAVVGFITPLMVSAGASDSEISRITATVMGGATLIAYIIGEGMADAAGARHQETAKDLEDEEYL